jgi:putative ABC transport system permease protein
VSDDGARRDARRQVPDRLRDLFPLTRKRIRSEVDEEIALHIAARISELERNGMSASEAHAEALRRFGEVAVTRAVCIEYDQRREARLRVKMEWRDALQDVRIACRQVWRRPGFTITVVLTLALGIGAATTVFSVADHVVLRPLPYDRADRVLTVWSADTKSGELRKAVSPGEFVAWSEGARSTSAWGLAEPSGYDLTGGVHPEPVTAWRVTAGFFSALGVRPMLGGLLTPEDFAGAEAGAGGVMISHALWQRVYGGDARIAGRTIQLDGQPAVVRDCGSHDPARWPASRCAGRAASGRCVSRAGGCLGTARDCCGRTYGLRGRLHVRGRADAG